VILTDLLFMFLAVFTHWRLGAAGYNIEGVECYEIGLDCSQPTPTVRLFCPFEFCTQSRC